MTIQLPAEKLHSKVIPYSDENAWVIIDRKLYELKILFYKSQVMPIELTIWQFYKTAGF